MGRFFFLYIFNKNSDLYEDRSLLICKYIRSLVVDDVLAVDDVDDVEALDDIHIVEDCDTKKRYTMKGK